MKNHFVSTLNAVALALPLGVGGLAVAAPVVATDAGAQLNFPAGGPLANFPAGAPLVSDDYLAAVRGYAEQIRHDLETCSRDTLHRCRQDIHDRVTGDFAGYFSPRALPHGSDGADQPAFEYFRGLHQQGDSGAAGLLQSIFTCSHASVQNLTECHPSIRDRVNTDPQWRIYFDAGDIPDGSDGRDVPSYEHFKALAEADERGPNPQRRARDILNELFPDGRPEPTTSNQRNINREIARRETDRRRILERDTVRQKCAEVNGRSEFNDDLNAEVCIATPITDFSYYRIFDNAGRLQNHVRNDIGLQVTSVEPIGIAELVEPERHRQATSDSRAAILALDGELGAFATEIEDLNNSVIVNRSAIELLASGLNAIGEDVAKNTAGVALSLALDTPNLLADKRFAVGGGVASFRGESGVGFTLSGKLGGNIVGSVGGGLAGSGDTRVGAVKGALSYQW